MKKKAKKTNNNYVAVHPFNSASYEASNIKVCNLSADNKKRSRKLNLALRRPLIPLKDETMEDMV